MILGQIGLALWAKKIEPKLSLGSLFCAALWLDLVWPLFLWSGLESMDIDSSIQGVWPVRMDDIAYSHSFVMACVWGGVAGLGYYHRRRRGFRAFVLAGLVVAHWGVDMIFHRHDLPVLPWGGRPVGWGLWNSMNLTIGVQFAMLGLGIIGYMWAVRSEHLKVKPQFWWAMMVIAGLGLGATITVPQSQDEVVNAGLALWLLIPLGFWIDHKRPETYEAIR